MAGILVAFDDSEHAWRALDAAVERARRDRAPLTVLTVLELAVSPDEPRAYGTVGDGPPASGHYEAPAEVRDLLAAARDRVAGAGVRVDYAWAAGPPAQVIVEAAQARAADLVVLGQGHHGVLGRLLGADVAHEVRAHLGSDVLLVD